ncbi:kinase [Altericroceibacterium endophyticum]|uniref:Kinase n=1 Tax=Altericroceibacterium endophyticum TaxID=1808508 RepID=A0A6I4T647_9SPHN|nr:kinase [Altericroceibacterium endophyticum]MXO66148.1 kinase [Altericroceibacterium endophyticum]
MARSLCDDLIAEEHLPETYHAIIRDWWQPLAAHLAGMAGQTIAPVISINGGQGTGKSTLCRFLEALLNDRGINAVTLGLDDLYLPKTDRQILARKIHPLFATRGVPGTHDTDLGLALIAALREGADVSLPIFDKSEDDRSAATRRTEAPADIILFEGWCVGAQPQPDHALDTPINQLEEEEDPDAVWRRHVNDALAGPYARLFAEIDHLIMLKVEDFSAVFANRKMQEAKLAASQPFAPAVMDDAKLRRFVAHYERLTRWMLQDLPPRADLLLEIDASQTPIAASGPWADALAI